MGLLFQKNKLIEKQKKRALLLVEYETSINEFEQGCQKLNGVDGFSDESMKLKYIEFAKEIYRNIDAEIAKLDKERRAVQSKLFDTKKSAEVTEDLKNIVTTKGKLSLLQERLNEIVKKYTGEPFGVGKLSGLKQKGEV